MKKEAKMRDELYDRDYQAGRDALHDGIDHLGRSIMLGFRTLSAIQFAAPWTRKSRPSQSRRNPLSCG